MSDPTRHNVIIVGSGPAGYTAGIYTARAGLEPIIIAGSITAGGALMNTTEVENFPGFPEGVQGPDLMEKMQAQAEKFGAKIVWDDVVKADLGSDVKTLETSDGTVYQASTVIVSTGSEYRHLGLADEERLGGKGVSYCATCDGFFFRDKQIAVVGGGDSALEEATFLTKFASKVTVIHRRDAFRASKAMIKRAEADPKIDVAWNSTVAGITGADSVTGMTLTDTVTGSTRELPVSGVFVAIGSDPRTELFTGQLELDKAGYIVVDGGSSKTTAPGVFACGDVVDHTYRQAITAAGSGCKAALDAQEYLAAL